MTNFCDKCGAEVKEGTKFCHKCGAEISAKQIHTTHETIESGVSCPYCGKLIPIGQKVCLNCGQQLEDEITAIKILLIIIGFIGPVFIPLIGIIIGIYLATRNNSKLKTLGAVIIAWSILIWIITFIAFFS